MREDYVMDGNILVEYTGSAACLTIPEGVVKIAPGAMRDRKQQICELMLPSSLQEIGPYTFSGCRSLVRIHFGEGLRIIDAGAFSGCEALGEVRLPDSLTKIRRSAFSGCRALQKVYLPPALQTLADGVFFGCTSLQKLELPAQLKSIGSTTAVASRDGGTFAGSGLVALTVPAGVSAVGTDAFSGCSSLEKVILPQGLENIGSQAFSGCRRLRDLRIPASVTLIGAGAFRGIAHPETVALPRKLEKMRQAAGLRCSGMYGGLHIENGELLYCDPHLDSVTVPLGVTRIAPGAFNALTDELVLHPRSVKVRLPETLEVFERSRLSFRGLQFVFPHGYLQQVQPLPLPFTADLIRRGHLEMEIQDAAYLYLFQPEMLSQLAADMLARQPDQAARILFGILKRQRTRRSLLRSASFIKHHRKHISAQVLEAFYQLMLRAGEGAAAVRAARCLEKTGLAAAERFCRDAHPASEVDAALTEAGLDPQSRALETVTGRSGQKVDAHLVKCLFLPYLVTLPHVRRPDLIYIDLESAELEKSLNMHSVSRMLDTFMSSEQLFHHPRWLKAYCRFADTLQIAAFDRRLRTFSPKTRIFSWGSLALTLSDTREAMCRCADYAGGKLSSLLEHWCSLRGRKVPFQDGAMQLRLDEDGLKTYTFDAGVRTAGLSEDLKIEVRDAGTGEILTGDWDLPAEDALRLREDLEEMQERLNAFVSSEREALRQCYILGYPTARHIWERLYLQDPVRVRIAAGLLWTQGRGRSFMVKDGHPVCADGTPMTLYPHIGIQLAHLLEMDETEQADWRKLPRSSTFLDQLDERVHPDAVPADYCSGLSITVKDKEEFDRLFGHPSKGFSRLKAERFDLACRLDAGAGMPPGAEDEVHLGSLWTAGTDRTTNAALNCIEMMAIREQIKQDDPSVLALLERRGLRPPEVQECLKEAVRRRAGQLTALLLAALQRCGCTGEQLTLD